jgi:hypothetical protein
MVEMEQLQEDLPLALSSYFHPLLGHWECRQPNDMHQPSSDPSPVLMHAFPRRPFMPKSSRRSVDAGG